jgi:hypothetical protein
MILSWKLWQDLIHLETASKVFQLLMFCTCGWILNSLLIKYVTGQLNVLIPTDPTEVARGRNASNKQRS